MKKLFVLLLILVEGLTYGQISTPNNVVNATTNNSGETADNIGVGTNSPLTKFQVNDGANNLMNISLGALNTNANSSTVSLEPMILLNRWTGSGNQYVTNGIETLRISSGTNNYGLAFTRTPLHTENDYSTTSVSMYIQNNDGYIGIGTTSPTELLTVNGKILCEEVEVIQDVAPDYVFQKYYTGISLLKPEYKMPTLEEIEAFTKENHHLPEVPSAAEIKEDGMQLKEMTTLLLQKVEELTLYTIEQEKRIKALEAELAKQ